MTGFEGVAQVDDFTDGDFTNNPTWTGDVSSFAVITTSPVPSGAATTDGFYLASNTALGNVTLSMPSSEVTEWKFSWASPSFSPSASNYFGIILMSNVAVTGSITGTSWNGYFLQIGSAASNDGDVIELWEKNGAGSGTKVGDFTTPAYGGTALTNGINVRVTRSATGVFQLFYSTGFLYGSTPTTSAGTLTDNTTTTSSYFGVFQVFGNPSASRRVYIDNIVLGNSSPAISVSATTLTGFTYVYGSGPSASQSYNLSGSNLTPASGDITITPSANYEVSLDNTTFSQTAITKAYTSGALASTPVYVRLKAGLAINNYNGELIANSGGGATTVNVTCSGSVTTPPIPAAPVATAATNLASNSFTANWNASSGASSYRLDVYTKTAGANASDLFISEYIEGSSSNKYIEIYNGTGSPVDLSNFKLQLYANGSATTTNDVTLSGTLANGATIVYQNSSASLTLPSGVTAINNTAVNFNGDDAVALYKISTSAYVDIFGRIGEDPGTAWTGSGGYTTLDKTLVRKSSVNGGIATNPGSGFPTLTTEWNLYNIDDATHLGSHTFSGGTTSTPVYTDVNVGNVTSYSVTGLNPNTTYYYVVRAVNIGGTSANSNEISVTTLAAAPTISSFTPTSGCSTGGTSVTISGTNFTGATAVKFNGTDAASFSVNNSTTISATTPAGVTTGKISVTTPGGAATSTDDFTVTTAVTPSVTITASANPITSGTSVAITATPVNGGTTPMYQFYINNVAYGSQTSNPSSSFAPPAGTYNIHVVMTPDPSLPCFSPATATSNTIILVVNVSPATSTWTGSGNDQNWHNADNWDNGVPGSTTAVTIPSGLGTNYPTVSSSAMCASITIMSGASLINNGLLGMPVGQATVKRVISDASDDKWHLFISPITQSIAATGTSCFNGAYLDRYDEPSGEWVRLITGENVVPGYGYSINYLAGSRDLEFTGTLKNSPLSYSNLSYTSGASGYGPGWNLIGNPYPCGINPSLCAAPSGMNAYAYIWNTGSGNYDPLQFGSDETIIAPLQGFFVRTTSGTNSLSLANIAKTHGGTFYKNDNVEPEALMVRINGNNYSDQTKVRFNSDATAGFDQSYDAYKLWGLDEAPQLYSILSDEVAAVNTLPSIGSNPLVPLGLKVGAETSYILTFEGMDSFDPQVPLRLDDLKLGISKDLRTDPVYSFTAAPGDAENRFRLRFASAIGFEDPEASNILISSERNVIRVNYMGSAAGTIHLYNDAGQLLSMKSLNQGETTMSAEATGIYLVKVITGKSVVTKKVVVVR